jgi:hypothetical protein
MEFLFYNKMTEIKQNHDNIYDKNSAIELYLGEKRSGKTLSMIADTYEDTNGTDIQIFTNLWLNPVYFKNVTMINKQDIIKYYQDRTVLRNSIFLLDELHLICDARTFMNKENISFAYFIGQIGKRKNILRGTTHFPNLIDWRIREYAEKYIKVDKGFSINGQYRELKNFNKTLTKEEDEKLLIRNIVFLNKMTGFHTELEYDKTLFLEAHLHYDKYNTEEFQT